MDNLIRFYQISIDSIYSIGEQYYQKTIETEFNYPDGYLLVAKMVNLAGSSLIDLNKATSYPLSEAHCVVGKSLNNKIQVSFTNITQKDNGYTISLFFVKIESLNKIQQSISRPS